MKLSFFKEDRLLAAGRALYAAAVEQARATPLYAEFGVPDTIEGRFEMVTLHVYLVLRRLKSDEPQVKRAAQRLFDVMFENMDATLRELGVGDLSVARKIRALAENFYGRVGVYEDALQEGAPPEALAEALARNVYEDEGAPSAQALAEYVRKTASWVDAQPVENIVRGEVHFSAKGDV